MDDITSKCMSGRSYKNGAAYVLKCRRREEKLHVFAALILQQLKKARGMG